MPCFGELGGSLVLGSRRQRPQGLVIWKLWMTPLPFWAWGPWASPGPPSSAWETQKLWGQEGSWPCGETSAHCPLGGSGRHRVRCPHLGIPGAHTCAETWGTFCFNKVSGLAEPGDVTMGVTSLCCQILVVFPDNCEGHLGTSQRWTLAHSRCS